MKLEEGSAEGHKKDYHTFFKLFIIIFISCTANKNSQLPSSRFHPKKYKPRRILSSGLFFIHILSSLSVSHVFPVGNYIQYDSQ